jgi:hypothetical protein
MRRASPARVTRVTALAVLGLSAALVAARTVPVGAAPPSDKIRAERPVYQVGDKWVRTDGAYELVRINKDVYVFSAGAGNEFHLTKDLNIVKIVLAGRTELDIDSPPKFTWPLEVDKWGVGRAFWRSAPPRPLVTFTGSISVSWKVDLAEDLVTAAGTFRTLRINQRIETVSGAFGGSGQQFGQIFLWYAPDAQRFVKAESNLKGLTWGSLAGAPRSPTPPVVASPAPRPSPAPPADARPTPQPAPSAPAPVTPQPAPSPPTAAAPQPAPSAPAPAGPQPAPARPAPAAPQLTTSPSAPAPQTAPSPPAVAPPQPAPPPLASVPQPVAPLRRGDVDAPKIAINSPLPDARLVEEQILITGLVTDNVEVVRVQVLVNGVEATSVREVGVTGRGVPVGAIAALKPGPNVIEVIATNRAGNVAQLLRTVTRVVTAPTPGSAPPSAVPSR